MPQRGSHPLKSPCGIPGGMLQPWILSPNKLKHYLVGMACWIKVWICIPVALDHSHPMGPQDVYPLLLSLSSNMGECGEKSSSSD